MSATNEYEEDDVTATDVESGSITAATGWAVTASVNKLDLSDGPCLIFVHIQCVGAKGAASTVCTLPADFCPAYEIVTQNGQFEISTGGVVSCLLSTVAAGVFAVCEAFYDPWGRS